ncbi:uroporphyrinogen-III synthase [Pontivivens ytuae]|uniref:Uroporphyrinogen-III synthase n=1 Tax=Pontivivens ytuae TaxID=2789856 RepID=A0A7S9QDU1_9RHOB|nr:uroporphyrinogen-III synthase [Pontivivens ytuae]QPH55343.1 uroporphyrinogen-III synthase [Pontivivens ytuae]
MTKLLLTRPERQAKAFAARLPEGWEAVISPLSRIVFHELPEGLPDARGLIFTSQNGVEAWQAACGPALPAWCVGQRTTERAREAGLDATFGGRTQEELAETLRAAPPEEPLLHVSGAHLAGDLVVALPELEVARVALYTAESVPLTDEAAQSLASGAISAVAHFSPRAALLFREAIAPGWDLAALTHFAISAAALAPLEGLPRRAAAISEEPTAEGMLALLRRSGAHSATTWHKKPQG